MKYGICEWCGKKFPRDTSPKGGRPRKYCNSVCTKAYVRQVAQPAWYRREQRKRINSPW